MTLRWVPGWNGLTEPEAVSYVAAVEAADGQELEFGVAKAINDFVLGCKNDGIWDAIKASCILAGARTLAGALVPLVGTAPTKLGTEAGWNYNRETGLKGNATDNQLDSNRANNADPQNSKHISVYASSVSTILNRAYMGVAYTTGFTSLNAAPEGFVSVTVNIDINPVVIPRVTGFNGGNRSSSTIQQGRNNGTTVTNTATSQTPASETLKVNQLSDARLAFYSIGESLDLAVLDTRVSALITAIGAAIP
jgi:hypothetical protein